jgi:hypothetical protein
MIVTLILEKSHRDIFGRIDVKHISMFSDRGNKFFSVRSWHALKLVDVPQDPHYTLYIHRSLYNTPEDILLQQDLIEKVAVGVHDRYWPISLMDIGIERVIRDTHVGVSCGGSEMVMWW